LLRELAGRPQADLDAALDDATRNQRIAQLRAEWQPIHDQVVASGGLHIIGTERHESRRVDNQLRGRAGRQGDPGSSRFYLSLEDPLLRIFASDRVASIMNRFKLPEGEAIEHVWVTRAIENAQRKVEARNFDMRKQILNTTMSPTTSAKVIYQQRTEPMDSLIFRDGTAMRESVLHRTISEHITPTA
jgi:preprotein translocase subunit SecA